MTHMKRIAMPKSWPIARKGAKYVAVGKGKKKELAMPLLLALRDVLKIVKTKAEAKKILAEVFIDNKKAKSLKHAVGIFDVVEIPKIKKVFRMSISERGKLFMQEIKEQEAKEKTCKVIGKKMLRGKKLQINLHDGRNYIYEKGIKVNDSVVIDLEKNKIKEILPLKKNAKIFFIAGKHQGSNGIILDIKGNEILIKIRDKETKTNAKNIIVLK